MKRAYLLPVLAALSAGIYLLNKRAKTCGATPAEATRTLPGDELIPRPAFISTHATTIDAPPEAVWPWLIQMGYYRAGWYTENDYWWDRLSNRYLRFLVRREAERSGYGHRQQPSAFEIVPEWQQLRVGEEILDGPPGSAYFTVAELEPERALVLYSDTHLRFLFPAWVHRTLPVDIGGDFTWVFVLAPRADGRTRLLIRTRSTVKPWWYRAFAAVFLPAPGAALEMAMLENVKQRVESASAEAAPASCGAPPGRQSVPARFLDEFV